MNETFSANVSSTILLYLLAIKTCFAIVNALG